MTPIEKMIDSVVKAVEYDGKKPDGLYPTHEGIMLIGDVQLRVYVLSNGKRIINAEDVYNFFEL